MPHRSSAVVGMKRAFNTESLNVLYKWHLDFYSHPLSMATLSSNPNFKNRSMSFISAGTELSMCNNGDDTRDNGREWFYRCLYSSYNDNKWSLEKLQFGNNMQ